MEGVRVYAALPFSAESEVPGGSVSWWFQGLGGFSLRISGEANSEESGWFDKRQKRHGLPSPGITQARVHGKKGEEGSDV